MDLSNNRYPWSGWDGDDFVVAYRRFVDECRKFAPKARFMWSPRGERTLNNYYPGDTYVDLIGVSLFGLQGYDVHAFDQERSFRDLFSPTYELLAKYDKPVYIAEFGCSGDASYIAKCADFRPETLAMFPRLVGVIYFSALDSGIWPKSYGKPDWRVTPESSHFLK
jgi:beta-mannanase